MEIDISKDYKAEIDKNLSFFVIDKIDSKKNDELTIKNSIDYAIFRKIGGEYYQISDIVRDYEANENDLIYCVDTREKNFHFGLPIHNVIGGKTATINISYSFAITNYEKFVDKNEKNVMDCIELLLRTDIPNETAEILKQKQYDNKKELGQFFDEINFNEELKNRILKSRKYYNDYGVKFKSLSITYFIPKTEQSDEILKENKPMPKVQKVKRYESICPVCGMENNGASHCGLCGTPLKLIEE